MGDPRRRCPLAFNDWFSVDVRPIRVTLRRRLIIPRIAR